MAEENALHAGEEDEAAALLQKRKREASLIVIGLLPLPLIIPAASSATRWVVSKPK